jgi:hypothetical protein
LENSGTTRSAMPLRKIRVTLTSAALLEVDIDTGSGFVTYIPPTDVKSVNGSKLPATYRVGFASATEGCVDASGAVSAESFHEVQDLMVTSAH